jgi:tRNA(His) guanylyltransferase
MHDPLGDRMKSYEHAEAGKRLLPMLPVIARADGRGFSAFTRDLPRPFDPRLSRLMVETARLLARETCARLAYTQSDEITLVMYAPEPDAQVYFDGRVHKMVSQVAAFTTAVFNRLLPRFLPEKAERVEDDAPPTFDTRVFCVPTLAEGANAVLWREQDAVRNSVSMAARAHFGHAEVDGRSAREMREMLRGRGVAWEDFPAFFRRGTYLQRRTVRRKFTAAELEALPPRHNARLDPDLEVERTEIVELDVPSLSHVSNREGVVFFGESPVAAPPR